MDNPISTAKPGPVQPLQWPGEWHPKPSLTDTLDLLATHAPEPPWWFEPVGLGSMPRPIGQFDKKGQEAGEEWERKNRKERMFQWPYFWAREVLKRKNEEKPYTPEQYKKDVEDCWGVNPALLTGHEPVSGRRGALALTRRGKLRIARMGLCSFKLEGFNMALKIMDIDLDKGDNDGKSKTKTEGQ